MSLDGAFRPSQVNPYADSIGTRTGAERLAKERKEAYSVAENARIESSDKKQKDEEEQERKKRRDMLLPEQELDEELENDIRMMLEQHFDLFLNPKMVYRFGFNEHENKIELRNVTEDQTILQIEPEKFLALMGTMRQSEGMITDRRA